MSRNTPFWKLPMAQSVNMFLVVVTFNFMRQTEPLQIWYLFSSKRCTVRLYIVTLQITKINGVLSQFFLESFSDFYQFIKTQHRSLSLLLHGLLLSTIYNLFLSMFDCPSVFCLCIQVRCHLLMVSVCGRPNLLVSTFFAAQLVRLISFHLAALYETLYFFVFHSYSLQRFSFQNQ